MEIGLDLVSNDPILSKTTEMAQTFRIKQKLLCTILCFSLFNKCRHDYKNDTKMLFSS